MRAPRSPGKSYTTMCGLATAGEVPMVVVEEELCEAIEEMRRERWRRG
jgi:hypothetical protein